jgi:Exopolysaccharide synthesis, ExoD
MLCFWFACQLLTYLRDDRPVTELWARPGQADPPRDSFDRAVSDDRRERQRHPDVYKSAARNPRPCVTGTEMQDIPLDTKKRGPSSRLLQELIRQAPAEYVTVGWLISHRHSFGIAMLCLGLLATTPVGSMLPGVILAVMAVQMIAGRAQPVFPRFIMTRRLPTKQLLWLGARGGHVLKYFEKVVHPRWPRTLRWPSAASAS